MTWEQLYALATPEERLEIFIHMAQTIEARERRLIFTGIHLVRERRRTWNRAHYINNRRNLWYLIPKLTTAFILATVTIALVVLSISIPKPYAIQLIFVYQAGILAMLYLKPIKRRLQTKTVLFEI